MIDTSYQMVSTKNAKYILCIEKMEMKRVYDLFTLFRNYDQNARNMKNKMG